MNPTFFLVLQEEKRAEVRKIAEPHPSHGQVHAATMAKTGGKHLSPMELAVQVRRRPDVGCLVMDSVRMV